MTLRDYLQARIDAIKAAGHGAELAHLWPASIPTLKASDAHAPAELDLIERAIGHIEQVFRLSFVEGDPRQPAPAVAPIVEFPTLDEGGDSPPVVVETLRARYNALTPAQRATLDAVTGLAKAAGHPLDLNNQPTRRRAAIADALMAAADLAIADIFDLVAEVTGVPDHADAGVVIGTLTIDQAHRLADAVAAFRDNNQATKAS
jgi:hypothetical protein